MEKRDANETNKNRRRQLHRIDIFIGFSLCIIIVIIVTVVAVAVVLQASKTTSMTTLAEVMTIADRTLIVIVTFCHSMHARVNAAKQVIFNLCNCIDDKPFPRHAAVSAPAASAAADICVRFECKPKRDSKR